MAKKLTSVIIPTYSRPNYIIRAIESVLQQSYPFVEVIVVDDNGKGTQYQLETEALLKPYILNGKLIYIKHDVNLNGAAARNTGIRHSKGEYVTFLDDDDVMHPDKIAEQVAAIELNKEFDIAYCGFRILHNGKELKKVIPTKKGNMQYDLLTCRWSIGTGSNPLFTRKVFDVTGMFDETFIRHQDVEFLVRSFRDFKAFPVDKILIDRYIDSRINVINHEKLLCVKEKFLTVFKTDINQYTFHQQCVIYRNHYADVGFHAVKSKSYKAAWKYYMKANSYALLTPRIIAKAILYIILKFKIE